MNNLQGISAGQIVNSVKQRSYLITYFVLGPQVFKDRVKQLFQAYFQYGNSPETLRHLVKVFILIIFSSLGMRGGSRVLDNVWERNL